MDSSDVGALCIVPTKDVIDIFFDLTQLPPDLIYTICGYYNDWYEYEDLIDLKEKVIREAHNIQNKWHYTYNTYYNQKYMVQSLREYMLNMNCKETLETIVYKNKKDVPGTFFNFRLHLDIACACGNIGIKIAQYWARNETNKTRCKKTFNILGKYSYRKRIRKIMLKDLDMVLVFKAIFDAVYERAVQLKIKDKKTSQEGREMWEQELRECERTWGLEPGFLTGTDLKK